MKRHLTILVAASFLTVTISGFSRPRAVRQTIPGPSPVPVTAPPCTGSGRA